MGPSSLPPQFIFLLFPLRPLLPQKIGYDDDDHEEDRFRGQGQERQSPMGRAETWERVSEGESEKSLCQRKWSVTAQPCPRRFCSKSKESLFERWSDLWSHFQDAKSIYCHLYKCSCRSSNDMVASFYSLLCYAEVNAGARQSGVT